MTSLPIRKERAYLAEVMIKRSKYDLFIFVEDANLTYIYEKIIYKLFGDSITVGKIFSLKSKENVLNLFEEWLEVEEKLKNSSLFIVDRDFDHLLNKQVPQHPNLVELERYTLENYLISKKGALALMKHKINSYDNDDLEKLLDWDNWIDLIHNGFTDLFICYGIAHKYALKENSRLSPHKYFEDNTYTIKASEIDKYVNDLTIIFETSLDKDFISEFQEIKTKFIKQDGSISFDELIKGKYILAGLFRYLKHLTGKKMDDEFAKSTLLDATSIKELSFLKSKVENILP